MERKTLQQDGINFLTGIYVERTAFVDAVLKELTSQQHIVLSSPPARGKTSVLQLLSKRLKDENERVFRFIPKVNSEKMMAMFESSWSIPTSDLIALESVDRCWILVDEAQRAYGDGFDALWEFLIKDVACNPNIKVIIAGTHDFSTLGSPASIRLLPHLFHNFQEREIDDLVLIFCNNFEIDMNQSDWVDYWNAVKELSLIDNDEPQPEFHIGVVLRCMIDLDRFRKIPSATFCGKSAQQRLRKDHFIQGFDRCFAINTTMLQDAGTRNSITDVVVRGSLGENDDAYMPPELLPMVRAGVLTLEGRFTCQAAQWFYNSVHFPNRAQQPPDSLQELVEGAVELLSATRIKSCVQDDRFPLETSFQHLFNEAFTYLLPASAAVKPEYRTKAPGFLGEIKHGFIDFYVNDKVQWAIELLVLGRSLTEHRNRFHPLTGKYRTLPTKKHLVVDIRGPRDQGTERPRQDLCVLYFSDDWTTCAIQMELAAIKEVKTKL